MIEAQPVAPNTALDPIALLRGARSRHVQRALTAWAFGTVAVRAARQIRTWVEKEGHYTVSVRSSDDLYADVVAAVAEKIPARDRRALLASALRGRRSRGSRGPDEIYPDGTGPKARLATFYDGASKQTFEIDGHRVAVTIDADSIDLRDLGGDRFHRGETLKFSVRSEAGRDAVLAWLATIVAELDEEAAPRFYTLARWGGSWMRRQDLETRTLDTVVLRAGQAETIVDDLERFLASRDAYARLGIPYHRGYLFTGPPGTGKSSLARALAAHFGLDVYYAPLADVDKDANLISLVCEVKPGSLLLLEDVDVFHAARERDGAAESGKDSATLPGLLNALDGVGTPNGLITVLTTNDPSVLDRALVRPGRVDRIEELGYLDDEQFGRLLTLIFRGPAGIRDGIHVSDLGVRVDGKELTPATILEGAKRHLDDQGAAIAAIAEIVNGRPDEIVIRDGVGRPIPTRPYLGRKG